MKKTLILLSLLMTSQTWASKCVIRAVVNEGMNCHGISTRLEVETAEACEAFARSTKDNRFFNSLEKKETILSARYKFKQKGQKNIKGKIGFASNEVCD